MHVSYVYPWVQRNLFHIYMPAQGLFEITNMQSLYIDSFFAQVIVTANVVLVKLIVGRQDDRDLAKLTKVISIVGSTHIFCLKLL